MKIRALLTLLFGSALMGQVTNTPLAVTRYLSVHSTTFLDCGIGAIDNRSTNIRRNDSNSFLATGTGTWTVNLNYSDTSCSGPWTSFGSGSTVTQATSGGIGFGNGLHNFIQIAISGSNASTVSVNYTAWKQMYVPTVGGGSVSFPISISQGGTGANNVIDAKTNLTLPELHTEDFNFTPQAPGGSLIAGGINQAVTLSPCPRGVNGTDTQHSILISGGTGAAEALLITGGTCTSNASSGTITITPANNHSGAWTVSSPTVGGQEAVQVAQTAGGGIVRIAPTSVIYKAGIFVSGDAIKVRGYGRRLSHITRDVSFPTFDIIKLFNAGASTGNEVSGLTLDLSAGSLVGVGVNAQNQSELLMSDLEIGTPFGIRVVGVGYSVIEKLMIPSTAKDDYGIYVSGGLDVSFREIYMGVADSANPGFAAIYLDGASAMFFSKIDAIQYRKGVFIQSLGAIQFIWFTDVEMTACVDICWDISPISPGQLITVFCIDCWASDAGNHGVNLDSTNGPIYGFHWVGGRVYHNGGHGIRLAGSNTFDTLIEASSISGNGVNSGDEIRVGAGVTKFDIIGNVIGMADAPTGPTYWNPTANYGVAIDAGGSDNYSIMTNRFTGGYVIAPISNGANGIHAIIGPNNGVDNLAWVTIPSATSITVPSTGQPGFFISGTSATTTITGGRLNMNLRIVKKDSGSLTVGGGGNIPLAHTMTQNTSLILSYDGTNWY